MTIHITAPYPSILSGLDLIKQIAEDASLVLERTPKGLTQTICLDNEEEGIYISISNK